MREFSNLKRIDVNNLPRDNQKCLVWEYGISPPKRAVFNESRNIFIGYDNENETFQLNDIKFYATES